MCNRGYLLFLMLLCHIGIMAQYSIKVGSYEYLELTPPAGWTTSASWTCDKEGIEFNERSEVGAIVKVAHYFNGTANVQCNYTYTYVGKYDNNYHVGHGSKSYFIKCIGGTATISETELEMKVGNKHTLRCTRKEDVGKISWSSTNEDVVTVDKNGKVTAVGSGVATIILDPIVTDLLFCNVRVIKIDPVTIELSPETLFVTVGKSKYLNTIFSPDGATATTSWTSSDDNIATVNYKGLVKGIAEGETVITATTDNGLSAKSVVKVIGPPTSVSLPSQVKIVEGFYYSLTPSLMPNGSETTYRWKSSDTSVATVSTAGKIYGKKVGQATITVTTENNLSASTIVNVVETTGDLDKNILDYRIETINKLEKLISKEE